MKNLLLIALLILTNISFSQTWTLHGKTTSKLIKTGRGTYALKYKSEWGDNIITVNLDGNASTVLYGNGVFAPASGGGE